MKEIEIRIRGGEVSVDLSGFEGNGCDNVMRRIGGELGGECIEDRKKPEYNRKLRVKKTVRQKG